MEANKVRPIQAKDTIMSKDEMLGCSLVGKYPFKDVEDVIRETCIHQIEITWDIAFKAGTKVGYSAGIIEGQYTNHKRHGKKMVQARQEGIREVVEWITRPKFIVHPRFYTEEWEAKLKEWGIEDVS